MLFNSSIFIFIFLPGAILFVTIFKIYNQKSSLLSLIIISLIFYGYWDVKNLFLLIISITVNYYFAKALLKESRKLILHVGIIFNLLILIYYKYMNFIAENTNKLFSLQIEYEDIVLPLAISFFTFQQIAFLIEVYNKEIKNFNLTSYSSFVVFFPQLIAGPIVRYNQISKQLTHFGITKSLFTAGISLFILGLFKKLVLADELLVYVDPLFNSAHLGYNELNIIACWGALLAYGLQIYFDFSGYCDMALGLGLMFGVKLPINFNSPYKSVSIIEFWRRWHITLSNFLKRFVYIPLGGSKNNKTTTILALTITMFIGGLWHGPSWNFVLWGISHGLLLTLNHLWSPLIKSSRYKKYTESRVYKLFSWMVTFLSVNLLWVLFRANDLHSACLIYEGLFGLGDKTIGSNYQPILKPINSLLNCFGFSYGVAVNWWGMPQLTMCFIGFLICILLPNSNEYFRQINYEEKMAESIKKHYWNANFFNVVLFGILLGFSMFNLIKESRFLYFQF